ncbi:glycosyltransferase family 2 protein [Wenzhouxiangella sp. EGI_FJ10305]|uniref:glycosyltransferase family 2 protein n=1 Tax=Wenzhouxiangella sp. EGI_FJ10305 TaxID=3243768 RepID=UPI0035E23CE0
MLESCVSIVTPAHNAANVVERAVASVAKQGSMVLEHIVVDDGSTDETNEVLKALARAHSHLVVLRQTRRGAGEARNFGIKQARGRYIAFLDSDDEWKPAKLERQIGFMEETGTLFSYGDYLRRRVGSDEKARIIHSPDKLRYADLLHGCPIGCLTVAFNQEVLGKRYMPDVRRGQDWGLWLNLTRGGIMARRYPGIEAIYHVRRGSLSGHKLKKVCDVYRIYREQEGLGRLHSASYLMSHSLRSFTK